MMEELYQMYFAILEEFEDTGDENLIETLANIGLNIIMHPDNDYGKVDTRLLRRRGL